MKNGISDNIELEDRFRNWWGTVKIEEKYSIEENKSFLDFSATVSTNQWRFLDYNVTFKVFVNDININNFFGNVSMKEIESVNSINKNGSWVSEINHDDDGSKNIKLRIEIFGERSGTTAKTFNISGEKNINLSKIPRKIVISATDAYIFTGKCNVNLIKASDELQAKIKVIFGNSTLYLTNSGNLSETEEFVTNTSISFVPHWDYYLQIPNSKYGICKFICYTYVNNVYTGQVSEAQCKFFASEEDCAPEVTGSVEDINGNTLSVTQNKLKFIKYKSTALASIVASPQKNATIVKRYINDIELMGENSNIEIYKISTNIINFKAVDSRGYETTYTLNLDMVDYIPLTLNINSKRDVAGNATIKVSGNYFNGKLSDTLQNSIQCFYNIEEIINGRALQPIDIIATGNSFNGLVKITDLDYKKSYKINVTVKDKLEELSKITTMTSSIPIFDWGANDISFNVPIKITSAEIILDNQNDEKIFEMKLDEILLKMNKYEKIPVTFLVPVAVSGYAVHGFIFKESNNYAYVVGSNCNNEIVYKNKYSGKWNLSKKKNLF